MSNGLNGDGSACRRGESSQLQAVISADPESEVEEGRLERLVGKGKIEKKGRKSELKEYKK
ncbi:2988_t:CDS:2 [Paraglomus occultum]|uniref:2988_t:CDS:1 n=1 Tax=Paraglomus occultum TaxID=144539 RepID=A0A9N9ACV8_9GLOM|nr:2988_t:CDS:2 [Paraglomus occultum]